MNVVDAPSARCASAPGRHTADARLPALRRIIRESLSQTGGHPDTSELDVAFLNVLAAAQEELRSKPEAWSLHGWLAWVARTKLRQRVRLDSWG
jgi:hypothetical protein